MPKITEINLDHNQPATRGDLAALERRLDNKFASKDDLTTLEQRIDQRFVTLEQRFDKKFVTLEQRLDQRFTEILDHFDAVAENIHLDVAGANKDEISLIKDQQIPDLNDLVQVIEKHVGLPVGPRYSAD